MPLKVIKLTYLAAAFMAIQGCATHKPAAPAAAAPPAPEKRVPYEDVLYGNPYNNFELLEEQMKKEAPPHE